MSGSKDRQLSRGALIALVIGSMVGAGIFTLPAVFGRSTGALGTLIASGVGPRQVLDDEMNSAESSP